MTVIQVQCALDTTSGIFAVNYISRRGCVYRSSSSSVACIELIFG